MQYRKNGEPVIAHCLATAEILAGIGADSTVVAAGLLHDVLDDTPMSEQQLSDIFGPEMTGLIGKVGLQNSMFLLLPWGYVYSCSTLELLFFLFTVGNLFFFFFRSPV